MTEKDNYDSKAAPLTRRPPARDEMTKAEFDAMMTTGMAQAKAGESLPVDEAFSCIIEKLDGR